MMPVESERNICEIGMTTISSVFGLLLGSLWLYDSDASGLQLAASMERAHKMFDWPVTYSYQAFSAPVRRLPLRANEHR